MKRFHQYIENIQSGKQIAGELIKLAIQRHLNDLERKDFIYYFDEHRAGMFIRFAEICRHWKNSKFAGKPIILEPHQVFYFGSIFGWIHKETGLRRFTTTYKQVARKNGKTTELAIISLYHLLMDNESGGQVYCAATKEEQARILVNDAGQIANITPEFKKFFKLFKYKELINRVVNIQNKSFITALGRDSNTSDGFDPSMGNIDEFHEHKNTALLEVIESGMGARSQPLINIITTAGFNKSLPCYSVTRKTAIEILKGIKVDDSYFCMIFEQDDTDDWKDETIWIKSNPNLDISVTKVFLKTKLIKAINEAGSTEVNFKTKHLNVWTDAEKVWIQDETWLLNTHQIDKEILKGRKCWGGLDLAKGVDINSFALLFPEAEGKFCILAWFWIPEVKMINNKDNVDYKRWEKEGYIRATSGNIVDIDFITYEIKELAKIYNIQSVAFDRWFAFNGIIQNLLKDGLKLHELGQGFASMTTPTIEFENLANGHKFEHFNNPILRWMMSNVEIERDAAGNPKPSKKKSIKKIDGIVAIIDALAEYMSTNQKNKSIYNRKELFSM